MPSPPMLPRAELFTRVGSQFNSWTLHDAPDEVGGNQFPFSQRLISPRHGEDRNDRAASAYMMGCNISGPPATTLHQNKFWQSERLMTPIPSKPARYRAALLIASLMLSAAAALSVSRVAADEGIAIPAPAIDEPAGQAGTTETAVFAGGCFWGVQGVFQHVKGVTGAVSGYAGGKESDAHYRTVGTGQTGHAESVRVTFDPTKISYARLLQIYFSVAHDPTELNRQGPDTGPQYRSAIFPTSNQQAQIAKAYIAQLDAAHVFSGPIATTIEPDRSFYVAEDYHQNFLTLNPTYPYIVINDLPKIENLKRLFPETYRTDPVLVAVAKPSN